MMDFSANPDGFNLFRIVCSSVVLATSQGDRDEEREREERQVRDKKERKKEDGEG